MRTLSDNKIVGLVIVLLVVVATATYFVYYFLNRRLPAEAIRGPNVPSPILLVHGYGGKVQGWFDAGLVNFFEQKGLQYGGTLFTTPGGRVKIEGSRTRPEEGDFFSIQISDPFQSLNLWQRELKAAIRRISKETRSPKVTLVSFSAGGVASRKYLVENLRDHSVAKLLTISSPHRGTELALTSGIKDKVRAEISRADSEYSRKIYQRSLEVIESFEEKMEVKIDAPLFQELAPEQHNGFLAELNHGAHPEDVEYACLLFTGSPPISHWRELQAELSELRGLGSESRLLESLSNAVMKAAALYSGNESAAGDGVILLASQNLGRVHFFESRPHLIKSVQLVDSSHMQAKGRYREIWEAIAGDVIFVRAKRVQELDENSTVEVDFFDYFGGLAEVKAETRDGRLLRTSNPVIHRGRDENFARVRIELIGEPDPKEINVVVTSASGRSYGKTIFLGSNIEELTSADEIQSYYFSILSAWGTALEGSKGRQWDLWGRYPDLQAILLVNGKEVFRTSVFRNVKGFLDVGESGQVNLNPLGDRIVLKLWDIDPPGIPEEMGQVIWNPGQLSTGRQAVLTDTGISVGLEIYPHFEDGIRWDREPLLLQE